MINPETEFFLEQIINDIAEHFAPVSFDDCSVIDDEYNAEPDKYPNRRDVSVSFVFHRPGDLPVLSCRGFGSQFYDVCGDPDKDEATAEVALLKAGVEATGELWNLLHEQRENLFQECRTITIEHLKARLDK